MTVRNRRRWMALGIALCGLLLAQACGGEEAQPECDSHADCAQGEICDQSLGVCTRPRTNSANNSTVIPDNQGNDSQNSNDNNNSGANTSPGNDSTNSSNNSSPGNGSNNDGPGTNDVTNPENTGENDPESPCSQEFDACDPSQTEQGSFLCLETEGGEGACFMPCDDPGQPSNCAPERYCIGAEQGDVCGPTECDSDLDCGTDTCIHVDNSYAFCRSAGSGTEGSSCQGGESGQCQQGLACTASEGSMGECRSVCDPWGIDECGFGQECAVRWLRTGVCTTNQTTTGIEAFDVCSPQGAWCNDATTCVDAGEDNICLKYCRPGMSDCPFGAICDEYFFLGIDNIGACMPPCENAGECGEGWDCVGERCRMPCVGDSDCCDPGETDCSAECEAGYCI